MNVSETLSHILSTARSLDDTVYLGGNPVGVEDITADDGPSGRIVRIVPRDDEEEHDDS